MSEKKPQSFRADPIFLGHLRKQASHHGLSMSDLVVRYLKVAYKLHQKYPDILGLGAQVDLDEIPEEEVRAASSQALFSGSPAKKESLAAELLKIKNNYEKSRESLEEQKQVLQKAIEGIPALVDEQVSKRMFNQ